MFSIGSIFSFQWSVNAMETYKLEEGDILTFHCHKIEGESGIWQIKMFNCRECEGLPLWPNNEDDEYLFKSTFNGLSKGENGRWRITASDCEYDIHNFLSDLVSTISIFSGFDFECTEIKSGKNLSTFKFKTLIRTKVEKKRKRNNSRRG